MSFPPDLPPGLPPLPKSLSAAASSRDVEHFSQKSGTSVITSDQKHGVDCTSLGSNYRDGSLSSTQDSTSDRESLHSRASLLSAHDAPTSTCTLDTQIALLRREMYSLRQLDLSLLSQLWALNESIQSFRTVLQDREEVSPSPTPSNTNSVSSEDEPDEQSFSLLPQAPVIAAVAGNYSSASTSTSTSNSSAANTGYVHLAKVPKHTYLVRGRSQQSDSRLTHAQHGEGRTRSQQSDGRSAHSQHFESRRRSQQIEDKSQSQMSDSSGRSQKTSVGRSQSQSGGGRTHPQLPAILQQRMRRPPPPPPPARGSKSPSMASGQNLSV